MQQAGQKIMGPTISAVTRVKMSGETGQNIFMPNEGIDKVKTEKQNEKETFTKASRKWQETL